MNFIYGSPLTNNGNTLKNPFNQQSVNDTVYFENVCDSDEYCFPQRDVAEFEVR